MPLIEKSIEANAEDGDDNQGSWWPDGRYGGGFIRIGRGGGALNLYSPGLSFLNVQIPSGSIIVSVKLEIFVTSTRSPGNVTTEIHCASYKDAPQWSSGTRPTTVDKTVAFEQWTPADTLGWQTLTDFAQVLQEVVDTHGGVDGRLSLALIGNATANNNDVIFDDFSKPDGIPARITIDYSTGDGPQLYKPSWPIELLHRASYREPTPPTLVTDIFQSAIISE